MDSMGANKYSKGKIYKITDVGYNKCYIGSTTENLSKRMARHRDHYKMFKSQQGKYYSSFDIFDEFGMDNCKIELMENWTCGSKEELMKREGRHIQENECVNKRIAGRTRRDKHEQNKESVCKRNSEYYHQTRLERRKKQKEYYDKNKHIIYRKYQCDCGSECAIKTKRRHETSQKHQDWLKEQEPEKEPQTSTEL